MVDRQYLEEQLTKDYELLRELEDDLRLADNPKQKAKLKREIEEVKQSIAKRKMELQSLENEQYLETTTKLNQESSTGLDDLIEGACPKADTSKPAKELVSLSTHLSTSPFKHRRRSFSLQTRSLQFKTQSLE